jgi:hypothetical protein
MLVRLNTRPTVIAYVVQGVREQPYWASTSGRSPATSGALFKARFLFRRCRVKRARNNVLHFDGRAFPAEGGPVGIVYAMARS